jgi:hypothetical protein
MGKYYGFDEPKVENSTKQDLTSKSAGTAFDIVYRENTQDFDLSNDYSMFAYRMSLKYVMNEEQLNYLLSEFNKKDVNKEFVLNESYKSIPDNPKLEYFTIKWAEGYPEYIDLLPKTFKSFKQANKFIEDNVDIEDGGYDKHSVEWKFNFLDMVFTDRWDIGKKLNPKDWSNIWAKEILSSLFYNILTDRLSPDDIHNNEAVYTELGKDGFELTNEEFYKIVNDFCDVNNTQVNVIKNYTTTQSRIDKLKESLPKIFSLFDKKDEQVVTPEMIQKQIDSLSILAKYGNELAARKIKILQILLKK